MGVLLAAMAHEKGRVAPATTATIATESKTVAGVATVAAPDQRFQKLVATDHAPLASVADDPEIDERAGVAADCLAACYHDAWARMQVQRLPGVPDGWQDRAVDCAGLLLDRHGEALANCGWTPGDLFDIPRPLGSPGEGSAIDLRRAGLCWQLRHGDVIDHLDAGAAVVQHPDGRCWTFRRGTK